ncbi:MAG TPA: S41 family peptidase [Terriglobales bacterium]|nr:S41 family peptidase [Terriglobales bacterium]
MADARQGIEQANSYVGMVVAIFKAVERLQDGHTRFIPPPWQHRYFFGFQAKAFGDEVYIWDLKKKGVAERAGLQIGDRILSVNGARAERSTWSTLIAFLRFYAPAPKLHIGYSRHGGPMQTVQLEGRVEISPAVTNTLDSHYVNDLMRDFEDPKTEASRKEGVYRYAPPDKDGIGYLELRDFEMSEYFMSLLTSKIKNAKAVVVDLRGNQGGGIDTLSYMTGLFESEPAKVADIVGRRKTEPIKVKVRKPNIQAPLYILADSESASAAEIFARFFQRKGRAVVLGDRTAGSVKAARVFSDQVGSDIVSPYATEVSVGRVVLEGGEEIGDGGVTPDSPCLPSEDDLRQRKDICLAKAYSMAKGRLQGTGQELRSSLN